jgi:hypothetical protein
MSQHQAYNDQLAFLHLVALLYIKDTCLTLPTIQANRPSLSTTHML